MGTDSQEHEKKEREQQQADRNTQTDPRPIEIARNSDTPEIAAPNKPVKSEAEKRTERRIRDAKRRKAETKRNFLIAASNNNIISGREQKAAEDERNQVRTTHQQHPGIRVIEPAAVDLALGRVPPSGLPVPPDVEE